jgi:glyoxylase-like metal-dependent hydrolase (beta-lactamase superfamily II)
MCSGFASRPSSVSSTQRKRRWFRTATRTLSPNPSDFSEHPDLNVAGTTAADARPRRLQKSITEAGLKPEDVDAIVCSHAHVDHIGGIVDEGGKPLFPNAQVYISQADLEFWTDEKKLDGPLKDFIAHARKNLMPVRDRILFFKDGQEFLPGVTAIAAPGHTFGHHMFIIQSEGKSFAFLGDLTHHQVLLLERPRMEFAYDSDPKMAAATRVKMLDMLAANKTAVMSYHFAWPGYGHVVKAGDGFRYIAEPMIMNL